ncbi:MAG: alpha/beta hydrolase [Burkholderiaceae bacterium]
MALAQADDPDAQMPMPFALAEQYAQQVMAWSRALHPGSADVDIQLDQRYGDRRLQRFNVFSPKGATQAPMLIFWHGGGWTNGYRAYVHFMAAHVARMGFVLVAPSYRLAPADRLPAAIDDAIACATFVAQHAHRYGGNGSSIVLSGHSAGAHLATMVALRSPSALKHHVRACLPISGIMDLHHPSPAPGSLEERVYTLLLADAAQDAVMSPMAWCAGNTLPFELTVGEHDSERVRSSNRRFAALLQAQGAIGHLHIEPAHNHFQTHTMLTDPAHPWYARLAAYRPVQP